MKILHEVPKENKALFEAGWELAKRVREQANGDHLPFLTPEEFKEKLRKERGTDHAAH